jgi:hypothetical protein
MPWPWFRFVARFLNNGSAPFEVNTRFFLRTGFGAPLDVTGLYHLTQGALFGMVADGSTPSSSAAGVGSAAFDSAWDRLVEGEDDPGISAQPGPGAGASGEPQVAASLLLAAAGGLALLLVAGAFLLRQQRRKQVQQRQTASIRAVEAQWASSLELARRDFEAMYPHLALRALPCVSRWVRVE